ncbi:MAG: twitch domain-containing radical SAM protein [Bacteriovoracaceae bacterium]|nr:twitch domain-containing radical SAM protein [Bacteriovoracaceae bacterium]
MAKKTNETYVNYRKRVMDPISRSFCAAKWYNASIWLNGGMTTSCHSPLAHSINVGELKENPSALHNTAQKKAERVLMRAGKRPLGCDHCWRMEDIGNKEIISDRVFKTEIYSDEDINIAANILDATDNIDLKTLEIAFNSNCNFACSYCNSSFSLRWANDIIKNGPYENLEHSDHLKFNHDGSDYQLFSENDEGNPFIKAFWDWWPELSVSLQELRITGGEPLLSRDVWRMLDYFEQHNLNNMNFAINTNLGVSDELVDRLIEKSKCINEFDIFTSCEAVGSHAEYLRDGLDYKSFLKNCCKMMENANINSLNMMMTITGLCLYTLTDFLDQMVEWKRKYGIRFPVWTVNILRFPAFMSPLALPKHLRHERRDALREWYEKNKDKVYITDMELDGIYRLIGYLDLDQKIHNEAPDDVTILHRDFKRFYQQYDQRRGKSFADTFPKDVVEWVESIKV